MASTRPLAGCATEAGTERYRQQYSGAREPDFFRLLHDTLQVSSLGLGTYLGECDEATDRQYASAVTAALGGGINLLDSAINYRCQRSERSIGDALRKAIAAGTVRRDEVVLCTKGGYVPLDGQPPATRRDYENFLQTEYFDRGIMTPGDVVAGGHCLTPQYIADQIQRSKRNLGVATIDIYYLHNPEQQLDSLSRVRFLSRMRDVFAALERAVDEGSIGCYGCATWSGFRVDKASKPHLDLGELVSLAREVSGADHHFRVVQLPINLAMPEAIRVANQRSGERQVPLLQAAADLGIAVIASASLMQGQLARGLPNKVREAFPDLRTDAQCAVAFVRGFPTVTAALVGMKSPEHLREQIHAVSR